MEKPKFNNTPNDRIQIRHTTKTGVNNFNAFLSRSVAVVGVVFAMPLVGGIQVLVTKRSMKMMDEKGKFGVPCGYLDYDETTHDAMIREVYEETSLYLPEYKDYIIFDNNKIPFAIHDRPTDNRQNVSLLFVTVLDFHENMEKFPIDVEKYHDHESELVKWMPLWDFYNKFDVEYEWAFKHNETIKDAIKFFNSNFNK